MNSRYIFLVLLSLLFSCQKRTVGGRENLSKKFKVENIDFQYFSSKSKVKVNNGDKSLSSAVQTRIRKDSAIWMSVIPALGLEAARVLITKDSLRMINRLSKEYFAYSYDDLTAKFGLPLDYAIIESLFTGNLAEDEGKAKARKKNDYFVQEKALGRLAITNSVSRSTFKLEKTKVIDPQMNREVDISYSDFKGVGENLIPGLISLVMQSNNGDSANMQMTISNQKIDIDKKKLRFPFSVSSKYERKH